MAVFAVFLQGIYSGRGRSDIGAPAIFRAARAPGGIARSALAEGPPRNPPFGLCLQRCFSMGGPIFAKIEAIYNRPAADLISGFCR
jgi:hypothetical protein